MSTNKRMRTGLIIMSASLMLSLAACGDNDTTGNPSQEPTSEQSSETTAPFKFDGVILTKQSQNRVNYSMLYTGNPKGSLTITVEGTGWSYGPTKDWGGQITPRVPAGTHKLKAVYTDENGKTHESTKEITFDQPSETQFEVLEQTGPVGKPWNLEVKLHGAPKVTGSVQVVDEDNGKVYGTGSVNSSNVAKIQMPASDEPKQEMLTLKYSGDSENPATEHKIQVTWTD